MQVRHRVISAGIRTESAQAEALVLTRVADGQAQPQLAATPLFRFRVEGY